MAIAAHKISFTNVTQLLERRVPQKPARYHDIPQFKVERAMLQPRSFPYNLPIGPHRPHSRMSRPPALGLGSIRGLKEKEKKKPPPQPSCVLPPIKEQHKEKKEVQITKELVRSINIVYQLHWTHQNWYKNKTEIQGTK